MQLWKNEQGFALLMTIVVSLILLMLGGAAVTYSMVERGQVEKEAAGLKAHYLARSGAEAVAQAILEDPDLVQTIKGKTSQPVEMDTGTFIVEVAEDGNNVRLISTGTAQGQSRTVQLTLLQSEPEDVALNLTHTMFIGMEGSESEPAIEYSGRITLWSGTLATNSAAPGSVKFHGSLSTPSGKINVLEDKLVNPIPAFPSPSGLFYRGSFATNPSAGADNHSKTIEADGYYTNLIIADGETLTIDLAKDTRTISVDKFSLDGKLELKNPGKNGRLILFVNEFTKAKGSINVSGEGAGRPDVLTVYYRGKKDETLGSRDLKIRGNVVVQNASVRIVGTDNFYGGVFLVGEQTVYIDPATSRNLLIYGPRASIIAVGAYTLNKGAIVAARLKAPSSGSIKAALDETLVFKEFPPGFFDYSASSAPEAQPRFVKGAWSAGK